MHVWNYNSDVQVKRIRNNGEISQQVAAPFAIIGPKDVEIVISKDGKIFTSRGIKQFAMASGKDDYRGEKIDLNLEDVRFIKLVIKNNIITHTKQ